MTATAQLADEKYLLLTTFRKDGTPVATPVWAVRYGDAIGVWTNASSGKVKRLRRSTKATVAPCTFRGQPTGPELPATATLVDGPSTVEIQQLMKKAYGLSGWLFVSLATLRSGRHVGIRITL